MEETNNISSGETGGKSPQPAATPAQFDQHGVNPEWVKEMTTPPHETDRGPDSGRTTRTIPTNDVPRPELLGQYARENVLSYAKGESGEAYDFTTALKSVMDNPRPENFTEFIQGVPAEHLPGLQDLFGAAIAADPENVIRSLIAMNHLPSWILPPAQGVVDSDDPMLDGLPPDLRSYVLDNVDPQRWDELLNLSNENLDRTLRQEMELTQMKQRQYQQRSETAVREWNEQMDTIENKAREAVFEAVSALQPFENSRANEQAQDMCVLASWAQALNDPHLQNLREVAGEGFQMAATERWRGNEKAAKGREMNARRLLAEFNKELKAKLDANIKQFQLFFEHAPGRRIEPPAQTEQPQPYIN